MQRARELNRTKALREEKRKEAEQKAARKRAEASRKRAEREQQQRKRVQAAAEREQKKQKRAKESAAHREEKERRREEAAEQRVWDIEESAVQRAQQRAESVSQRQRQANQTKALRQSKRVQKWNRTKTFRQMKRAEADTLRTQGLWKGTEDRASAALQRARTRWGFWSWLQHRLFGGAVFPSPKAGGRSAKARVYAWDGVANASGFCGRCIALMHVHKSAGSTLIRVLEDPEPRTRCGGIYYCNWRQYQGTNCQQPTSFSAPPPPGKTCAANRCPESRQMRVALSGALRWESERQDFAAARLYYGAFVASMSRLRSRIRTSCVFVTVLREPVSRLLSIALYCRHGLHMGTGGPAWLPVSQGGDVLCGGKQNGSLASWARSIGSQFFRQLALQPDYFSQLSEGRTMGANLKTQESALLELQRLIGRHETGKTRLGRTVIRKVERSMRDGLMPNVVGLFEQMPRTLLLFDKVIPLNGGRRWADEAQRLEYTHGSSQWAGQKQQLLSETAGSGAEVIESHLAADLRLYKAAMARFEQLCAEHDVAPPDAAELDAAYGRSVSIGLGVVLAVIALAASVALVRVASRRPC